jgi:hypothetical protein
MPAAGFCLPPFNRKEHIVSSSCLEDACTLAQKK